MKPSSILLRLVTPCSALLAACILAALPCAQPGGPLGAPGTLTGPIPSTLCCPAKYFLCGPTANPDFLQSTPQVIGQPWVIQVTSGFHRTGASTWQLYSGTVTIANCTGVPIPQIGGGLNFGNGPGRLLLVNIDTTGGFLCSNSLAPGIGTSSQCTVMVPSSFTLLGVRWYSQAIVLGSVPATEGGGNARLTTAIRGKIGLY